MQVPMRKFQNKWVAANYMEGSSEQCIEIVKHLVREEKEKPEAQKAVLRRLKDPDSAKFGSFTLIDDTRACLDVNAHNSYGGYTGKHEIWLMKISGEWQVLDTMLAKYASCVDIMRKQSADDAK